MPRKRRWIARLGLNRELAVKPPFRPVTRAFTRSHLLPLHLVMGTSLRTTFTIHVDGATFRYALAPGDPLGERLYWQRLTDWEPYMLSEFVRIARPARRVIDVGAHTGFYSLLACALNGNAEVYSFEPGPSAFGILQENLKLNGMMDRCRISNCAVAEKAGTEYFHIAGDPTMSKLSNAEEGELRVQTLKLDDTVPNDGKTDLIKIDVEGGEYRVLQGMPQILERAKPAIFFECNPGGPSHSIESLLRSFGYRLFSLTDQGCNEIERLKPEGYPHGQHNFLATHPERYSRTATT